MTDLEKRLEGKTNEETEKEINRIVDEFGRSDAGDWVRVNFRNRRDYLVSALESQRLDPNEMLRIVGELRALAGLSLVLFTPVTSQQNTGEQTNE